MIEDPSVVRRVFKHVAPDEFHGHHVHIASTMASMDTMGLDITPASLLAQLHTSGLLVRAGGGGAIHTMVENAVVGEHAVHLAEFLGSEAARNSLRAVGQRLVQITDNPEIPPEEAAQRALEDLDNVRRAVTEPQTLGWPDGSAHPSPEWIIPELMAVNERVMLTGGEGLGKTMLTRQLVASVAVGYHPFDGKEFDPRPALHIDLENPQDISDRAWRNIRLGLSDAGVPIPDGTLHRLQLVRFGITNARDVAWLTRTVAAVNPSIIAIGPVKNLILEDPNDESGVIRAQDLLNQMRADTGAALVLEGHAGYVDRGPEGSWRPRGSSAWLGWPEFGFGLKPVPDTYVRTAELVPWRGARAEGRFWPERIVAGRPWPWTQAPPM